MKLALVIEHFDATRGGAEPLAVWLAGEMARRGHEVHVLCHDVAARVNRYRQASQRASFDAHRSRRAHGPAEREHEGVHVHRLRGMRLNSALGFRIFGARARAWCRRRAAAGELDVVHSFTVAYPGDIYHAHGGVYAALQAQAAAIDPAGAWKRLLERLPGKRRTLLVLERRALKKAGRVVSVCAMMTGQLAAYYGAGAGKVVTMATPRMEGGHPDQEKRRPVHDETEREGREAEDRAWFRGQYGLGAGDRVAVFVGHDFRRKGLRYAIEAVARTADWKLIVVGLGKVREYVELAARLGMGPGAHGTRAAGARVLFIGPTREMAAVYAAVDALLLPAFYEPANVVVLEALAHGLPVVSTEFLGAADVVRQHHVGAIVDDPRNVAALAGGLEALPAAGSAERAALARRARVAVAGFSAQAFADQLERLYREVKGE